MRYAIIPTAIAALLAGCGSDDNSASTVTGQVIGSYFANAVVCLDTNHNGRCDTGESSTRSGSDGSFTLPQVANADYVAEIGTDATRYESGIGTAVSTALVFRTRAELAGTAPVLSAPNTFASAEMDAGQSAEAARQVVADRIGVDAAKVLGDYNKEADPVAKGLIKAWADPAIVALQDAVRTAKAGNVTDLAKDLRDKLTSGTAQKGSVRYAWTQIGADDAQPFSKLDISAISSGKLNDDPSKVANGSATFTTALASTDATLSSSGTLFARAIVEPDASGNASCPAALIDGSVTPMSVRAPIVSGVTSNGPKYGSAAPVDFKVLTCEVKLAATTRSVLIGGRTLKLNGAGQPLNRIVVVGDTGCRLKGPTAYTQAADGTASGGDPLQDCTSAASWQWPALAREAASFAPDLIIHNGDVHYREGFPEGVEKHFGGAANAASGGYEQDNTNTIKPKFVAARIDDSVNYGWRAWEEDFFKAAGPLLGAAPWAITRGNHELCDRAGQGWFRFLDPRRFPDATKGEPAYDSAYVRGSSFSVAKNCSQYTDPVTMTLGDLQLVLLDVGMMNDVPGLTSSVGATNGDHVRVARQLSAISALADSTDTSKVTWIVSHKPFFAYAGSAAAAGNAPQSAVARTWQLQKAIMPGLESVATGNGTLPANTQMTHAGHIHGFQLISHPTAANLPMSVLMGTTGDNLEGLIEANTGSAYATPSWGNNITGGAFPWLDQVINGVSVAGAKWYGSFASSLPVNFSSSPLAGVGKKETVTMQEYSYLVIDRIPGTRDWKMQVYGKNRTLLRTCTTSGKSASCNS